MTIANYFIDYESLQRHRIESYTERLREERAKPDSDRKVKAVAFLREMLWKTKQAHNTSNN